MQQPLPAAWIHNSHESERLWMLSEDKMSQCARQIVAVVFFFFPAAFFCAELKHFRKAAQSRVQTAGLEIPQKDLLHTVSQR